MTETDKLYLNSFNNNISLNNIPKKGIENNNHEEFKIDVEINDVTLKNDNYSNEIEIQKSEIDALDIKLLDINPDIKDKIKDIYPKFQEIQNIYPIDLYTRKFTESSENNKEYKKIADEYKYINSTYDMFNYKNCDKSKIIYIEGNENDVKNNIIFKKKLKLNDDNQRPFSIDSNINRLEKLKYSFSIDSNINKLKPKNIMEFLNVIDEVNKETNKKHHKIQNEIIYSEKLNTKAYLKCDNDLFIKIIKHTKYSYDIKNYERINKYYLDLQKVYNNNLANLKNINDYYSNISNDIDKNNFGKLLNFYNNYNLYFENIKELIKYYNNNDYYYDRRNKKNYRKDYNQSKYDFYYYYFPEIRKYSYNQIDNRINNFYDCSMHRNLSEIYNKTNDKKIIEFCNKFMNYINSLIRLCRNNKFDKDFKNFYERCKSLIDINDFNDIYIIYENYYNKLNNFHEKNKEFYDKNKENINEKDPNYSNFINMFNNVMAYYKKYYNEMEKILKIKEEIVKEYNKLNINNKGQYKLIIDFYNKYKSYDMKIFDFYLICDSYFDELEYIIQNQISEWCYEDLDFLKNNKNIHIKDLFDLYYMCKFYNVNIEKLSDKIREEKANIKTEIKKIKEGKIYKSSFKDQTPLMLAVYLGNFECAQIFINNINKLDDEGNNAMFYYLKSLNTLGEEERIKIRDLLTKYIKYPDYIYY